MSKGMPIAYSVCELVWIKKHQVSVSRAELTQRFNETFGRDLKTHNIASLCKRKGWHNNFTGRFVKGNLSWNKGKKGIMQGNTGSFKKGNLPHNNLDIGDEVITSDGYTKVKVANPKTWVFKHVLVYEAHNGEVPDGHVVRFVDGNKSNFSIANLMCVSRKVNGIVNINNPANTGDAELNRAILLTACVEEKIKECDV